MRFPDVVLMRETDFVDPRFGRRTLSLQSHQHSSVNKARKITSSSHCG